MPPARRSTRTASHHTARNSAQPYTRANRQRSPDPTSTRPSASIARPANGKTSLRLTVKAPPSKLRQATSGSSIPPNPYADNVSDSDASAAPQATRTARTTRNPRTVVEHDSDEEEDVQEDDNGDENDDDQDEDEDDDEIELDRTRLPDEDSEEDDAEGDEDEDEEEDEDDEMEDELQSSHPPPPIIRQERLPSGQIRPNVTVTAPSEGPMKSVEDKEMADASDEDEELSELDSNENDEEEGEEDEDDDSSEGDENDMSRSATPDLSKLTRRQRGQYEELESTNLMALSNEAQKKKHLTAEEHAMRRAEMARRRKNLSEKRNEEEKLDTINKLLKKPAPKRRTRAEIIAAQHADSMATPGAEEGEEERPDPLFVRWVSNREGSRIGVPEEWLEAGVGDMFRFDDFVTNDARGGRMVVEEVA